MSVKQFVRVAALAAVTGLAASSALAIVIPTVPIGNPGNAPDPTPNFGGYGSVAYSYNIGTTEVTNAQYAAFLNAVATREEVYTRKLYNTKMSLAPYGGITRSFTGTSYTYATISGRANHPVNYVSFYDAVRFANWLHNGQPTGLPSSSTTEDGAYTFTSIDRINPRNAHWRWAVTSENEWYKAAYHQPASQGGDADNYWLYPTSSNTITTAQANYDNVVGNTTPVGSYAANFYGTFDMGGNVVERHESIIYGTYTERGLRGAWFTLSGNYMGANAAFVSDVLSEDQFTGFRVVQVPGPSSVALLTFGGLFASRRRRRVALNNEPAARHQGTGAWPVPWCVVRTHV